MAANLPKQIIMLIVVFLIAMGGIVYSANFKGDKVEIPKAPEMTVIATESAVLDVEPSSTPTPEIASVKPRVNPTLKPTPTPDPNAGKIDCDLTPYGAGRSYETEAGCKEQIRIMLDSGNPGIHCSKTPQGCNTMKLPDIPKQIDLTAPAVGGSVDLHVDLPDYKSAIDGFNESVKMSPIPQPCVPVGDGFNCLK